MSNLKSETRAVIKYEWRRGTPAKEISARLHEQLGDSAPTYCTVIRWINRFKEGKEDLEDNPRSGRPSTSTDPKTVARAAQLLEVDRRRTLEEIADVCGISYGSAQTIVTQHLGMNKVCARWVPKLLTAEMKKNRASICRRLLEIGRAHV